MTVPEKSEVVVIVTGVAEATIIDKVIEFVCCGELESFACTPKL